MTRASEKAYEAIRRSILSNSLPTGAPLTEIDLAEQLGVSRTPVRDALRRLSTEGLVEFTSSQRASVASLEASDVTELFQVRAMLEGLVCSMAATRITEEEIAALEEIATRMEFEVKTHEDGYLERISELNSKFHRAILDATGSRRLATVLVGIIELPVVLRTFHRYSDKELLRSMGHHREIIDAFKTRDGEWARSVMQAHILAGRASYLRNGE